MEINICRRNKYGYCKYGDHCHFRHEKVICIDSNCNILNCEKRHPKICNWYQQYGRCKFTSFCKFKHENNVKIDELMKRLEENAIKLSEINKALEAIKKEEEATKNHIEVSETQEEIESQFTSVFELIEKNNEKILFLETSLKETRDTLEQVLNEKYINKNKKNNTLEDPPKFTCKMCDFESRSKSGLRNHIARKHTNYTENGVP